MAKLELINVLKIIKEVFQTTVKKNVLQLHQVGHFIVCFSAFEGAFLEQNLLQCKQALDSVQSPLIRFECCLSAPMHAPAQLHKCWAESRTRSPLRTKQH